MVRWVKLIAFLGLTLSLGNCDKEESPKPEPPVTLPEIGKAQVWLTTGDQSKLLSQENALSITELNTTSLPVISVDVSQKFQEIEGFGAALTGSSAYLINQKMTSSQRNTLLHVLFDKENGIGISYLRLTIGASDFSLSDYTYNDIPPGETDYDLTQFTIEKEKADLLPVLKAITSINPDIKIMGSPWSPPAWMKTNGSLKGGKLKPESYDVYSRYFVKYIKAMEAEGITINAITIQNEPLHSSAGYPCMEMTREEQMNFIVNHLGPLFTSEGISTKIIIYDHNWDDTDYAISILNNASAKQYVGGSAFHAYGGSVSAMSVVHNAHPDKGLYFTEVSGGEWAINFSDNLQWNMANIFIGTTKNWSKNALLWNLALDQNHGPKNNGCDNCRGVVTINSGSGAVTRNVEYYSIGHFSKFVNTGAFRILSSGSVTNVDHVAFLNPDNKRTIVFSNQDTAAKSFAVTEGDKQFSYTLPGKAVVTIVWD